ncbi:hypothetical protein LZ554_008321 [Drepanopeziza brunnea f. sp. 'monogermtubi']|nr:hypothetical protein LZ554_008321 [Drepanopeziza brunnea f. sp. 'monogermtubi']
MSYLSVDNTALRIQLLHIPGHTPDSLAWYDIDEHHLYVGDTFYERKRAMPIPELPDNASQVPSVADIQGAIIFPEEGGNWIQFMSSLDVLLSFILHQNTELRRRHGRSHDSAPRVKVGCEHLTHDGDAENMIHEVRGLFERIISDKVPVRSSQEKRGIVHDFWLEHTDSHYSVMAPRHLAEEAREHLHPRKTDTQSGGYCF